MRYGFDRMMHEPQDIRPKIMLVLKKRGKCGLTIGGIYRKTGIYTFNVQKYLNLMVKEKTVERLIFGKMVYYRIRAS